MTEEDESDKRISGWAGIMHDEFDFVKIMIHSPLWILKSLNLENIHSRDVIFED